MKNGQVRTAVVGAGKMGEIHAKVYHQLPDSVLTAIVDVDKSKAKGLGKKYKCLYTDNCSEIIGKVDAVTVATPTINHLEAAKLFIENGIAVLIEKPLAASAEQAREIVELAEKHKVVVAVGHSERCNPVVQAMKKFNI